MSDDEPGNYCPVSAVPHHRDDPHFEQIVNEIRDIQNQVETLVFGSVFLRQPQGIPENTFVPEKPSEVPSLEEITRQVDNTIAHMHELDDRLKGLLENKDNECYEDQIDEYLRELEDSERMLCTLKPMLHPERLRNNEPGKTDVSWLSWRRNTLGTKLHKESNELLTLIEGGENNNGNGEEEDEPQGKLLNRLKAAEALLKTADNLHRSAQYLSWFARRVLEFNESLPEFQRDFTVNLVAQWVQDEVNKVQEHHTNCMNFCSELSQKVEKK